MSKISLHIEKRGAEVAGSRDCGATRSRGYWTSRTPEPSKPRTLEPSKPRNPAASKPRSPETSKPRSPETSKPRSPAASKSNLKHNFE